MAWVWHRVVPLLERAGHPVIAVDLPGDDARVGLRDYAALVVRAIGTQDNVVLVAQSLGGFTAPLVCERVPIAMLVFVNAMIPRPGETAGDWWGNTGAVKARLEAADRGGYPREFDVQTYFLHDVPDAVLRDGPPRPREQAEPVFQERCDFERWPAVPMHAVASKADRFLPLALQRRVARDRLGKDVEVISGGHLVALSNPIGLSRHLLKLAAAGPSSEMAVKPRP
jgi:pimeloyl-ACP methyl ester carboxylesterase